MKFRITENDEQEGTILLGCVEAPAGMDEETANDVINTEFGEFQETEPDADSEFIAWLVALDLTPLGIQGHFKEVNDELIDITVGA